MRKLSLAVLVVLAALAIAVPAHAQSGGSGPPFNAQFGSGAPSVNCTPPSQGALARMLYWDTTNFVWYYCSATNTWTKFGTGTGSGTVGNCSTTGGWAYYAATGTTTSCLPFSVASLTALQGTDTKVMTAGAVSGTAATLCTDANGGATTSGCSSGGGTVTEWFVPPNLISTSVTSGTALTGTNAINWFSAFLPFSITVSTLHVNIAVADVSANRYDVCIYDMSGNLKANWGPTQFAATGDTEHAITQTSVTLTPGEYMFGWTGNSTTGRLFYQLIGAGQFQLISRAVASSTTSTSGTCPGTATIPSISISTTNSPAGPIFMGVH